MAVTIERLSGTTTGRPIKVAQTSTAGTLIHTSVNNTTQLDEVFLYAHNTATASVALTIEFGGTSAPDDTIILNIPSKDGLTLVIPGLPLCSGSVIRAFAATSNVITISGYIQRGP